MGVKSVMVDWNRVGQLLHIVDKSKDHPKLASLTNAALTELDAHAQTATRELSENKRQAAEEAERLRVEKENEERPDEENQEEHQEELDLEDDDEEPTTDRRV